MNSLISPAATSRDPLRKEPAKPLPTKSGSRGNGGKGGSVWRMREWHAGDRTKAGLR